jgi:hypothetical protein
LPRGDAFLEVVGAKIIINGVLIVEFFSKYGAVIGTGTGVAYVVRKKIPQTAVSSVLRNALPTMHSDYERKRFTRFKGKEFDLNQCDLSLEYMFEVLRNSDIPFKERQEISFRILMDHLDLGTTTGSISFVLCIISIMKIFSKLDPESASATILMGNLIKAIKEGKISKRLARIIVRILLRKKLKVNPGLISAAA